MLNENKNYCIYLEDHSAPRYVAMAKPYFGTMDDMIRFKDLLKENEHTCTRYCDLIDGITFYDLDWDMTHTVSGIEYKLLNDMTELCRYEIIMEKPRWEYVTNNGVSYPMYANAANVSQVLLQNEEGDVYRCIKAAFEGLMICAPGIGWYIPNGFCKGFPGMISFENNTHSMLLYVCEEYYSSWDLDLAMEDILDAGKIDLAAACRDIMGEV